MRRFYEVIRFSDEDYDDPIEDLDDFDEESEDWDEDGCCEDPYWDDEEEEREWCD